LLPVVRPTAGGLVMMPSLLLLSALHLVAFAHVAAVGNDRPIIGILSQPLGVELTSGSGAAGGNRTYIAASYVKFAESAGARVVPLHFDASNAELAKLFKQINGIIFPGGGSNIRKEAGNRFREASEFLFDLAVKANDNDDTFPIHGTCMGFQMLGAIVAQDDAVVCSRCYTTEGTPLPLNLTSAAKTSKLFSGIPADLGKALTSQKITENSHHCGIDPIEFEDNVKLKGFFRVLSTNTDPKNGKLFVSTMEATRYPISATQWHPEKNNFEWGKIGPLGYAAIPHSPEAVHLSQYVADNFVNRARQNSHRFASEEAESAALIYTVAPVPGPNGYFQQIYMWNRTDEHTNVVIV